MKCLSLFTILFLIASAFAGTTEEGKKWLEAKKGEPGVVTRPSGLLYKVLEPGKPDGKTPTINSPCSCHYSGTLIDGTEFDSSYKVSSLLDIACTTNSLSLTHSTDMTTKRRTRSEANR